MARTHKIFPPGPSYEQPFLGNRVSDKRASRKLVSGVAYSRKLAMPQAAEKCSSRQPALYV
jgi:hypothetical protein